MEDLVEQIERSSSILPARSKGNCRIWFTWQGKPVFLSAGTKKEKEARAARREIIRKWMAGLSKPAEKASAAGERHPWSEESARFVRLEHKHSKEGYRDGVMQVLRDFGAAAGLPDVRDMTKDRFREVWGSVEDGKSAHTKANWLGILGAFARFLEEDGVIPKDFTQGVRRPPRKSFGKRDQIYDFEAFEPIWLELPLWARPIWEDHWFTGMDTKDFWEFQPRKHLINVDSSWKIWKQRAKEAEIIDQPLASKIKERWIGIYKTCGPDDFMHAEARKRYASEKSWGNQIRHALHAAQKKLGFPHLDIKTTRHTFATRHLLRLIRQEKNAPSIDQIRRWMGHAPDSRVLERLYFKLLSLPHLMD